MPTSRIEAKRKSTLSPSMRVQQRRLNMLGWGFSGPFVLVFCLFSLLPLVSSIYMSFTDITSRDLRTPFNVNFVGLTQYQKVFADPRFWKAFQNTALFVAIGVPATLLIAMGVAVALNKGLKHINTILRALFYMPVVASTVAVAVAWRYILQKNGLLNSALSAFGIAGPDWLHNTSTALPALMVMTCWRNMGTQMIIFLAGLQSVPDELLEAAQLDGANQWQIFRRITLPILRPSILLSLILTTVAYLQFFEESFVMTQGGPLDSTLSASYYVYQQFGVGQYGMASASSWILFAIIAVISALQFRAMKEN